MLQSVVTVQSEKMSRASKVNEDTKASWNQLSDANSLLRAQLISLDVDRPSEQQDSSMRSPDEETLRGELAANLARESVWTNETAHHESRSSTIRDGNTCPKTSVNRRTSLDEGEVSPIKQANIAKLRHCSKHLDQNSKLRKLKRPCGRKSAVC